MLLRRSKKKNPSSSGTSVLLQPCWKEALKISTPSSAEPLEGNEKEVEGNGKEEDECIYVLVAVPHKRYIKPQLYYCEGS